MIYPLIFFKLQIEGWDTHETPGFYPPKNTFYPSNLIGK
jgi:hypothetical protein